MGYLTSKVVKTRLTRAGKELERFGRIHKETELSKAERKENITDECDWT